MENTKGDEMAEKELLARDIITRSRTMTRARQDAWREELETHLLSWQEELELVETTEERRIRLRLRISLASRVLDAM